MQRFLLSTPLILLVLLLCSASGELGTQIEALWRSGRGSEAANLIDAQLQAGNADPGFIAAAAEAMLAERRYEKSAALYAQLAGLRSADDAGFLDAKIHEWRARYLLAGENSRADWIGEERRRIQNSQAGSQGGIFPQADAKSSAKQPRSQLLLELAYCLEEATDNHPGRPQELVSRFPDSSVSLRLAAAAASDLGTLNNDDDRIRACQKFLSDWPGSYWRHVAYRYWLYSAWRLHDRAELSKAGDAYLKDFPASAESYGAVSRYMLDLDMPLEDGLALAKKSRDMFELELGINGDLASLNTMHDQTKRLPVELPYTRPGKRRTFVAYLLSRYNLARYMNRARNYDGAIDLVTPVIGVEPFLPSEEESLAPFLLEAGNAQMGKGNQESAFRFYLQAAYVGDSSDRYSGQAAKKVEQLKSKLDPEVVKYESAKLLPTGTVITSIPAFSNISFSTGVHDHSAARVAWVDINSDNAPDLLLDGSTVLMNELGRFRDRTKESGLLGNAAGAVAGDLDNDGDQDLYCFGLEREADRIYLNNGGTMQSLEGNYSDGRSSEAAAILDFDGDGMLDIYTANFESPTGVRREEDSVLLNSPSGFSLRDAETAGFVPPLGEAQAGRGVCAGDLDNDGLPDIFVSNYRLGENMLFSGSGQGSFREQARRLGLAGFWKDGNWGNTIGTSIGDIDNDGDLDMYCANLTNPRFSNVSDGSMLLVNELDGEGAFVDATVKAGIAFAATQACPIIFDANNDGWQDIFVTSIYPGRSSFLYMNDGHGHFVDMSYVANARLQDCYGAAAADYDNDGDLDLAVASAAGCYLMRNDSPARNWISFLVSGGAGSGNQPSPGFRFSNRSAIGTRLTIHDSGLTMVREVQAGNGNGCCNEQRVFFGLGDIRGPFDVEVRYPSGFTQTVFVRRPNKHFLISETDLPADPAEHAAPPPAAEEGTAETDSESSALERREVPRTR